MYSLPEVASFRTTLEGQETRLIHLVNNKGWKAALTNYGARLVALLIPDADGQLVNVVSGFNSIEAYLQAAESYYGVTVGRYANRISNACFSIDNQEYKLVSSDPQYCLHGGPEGFHKKVWTIDSCGDSSVTFSLLSADGDMGFPGNLKASVTYSMTDQGLRINYKAVTDKPTVCNLTHHSFFNLNGSGLIDGHLLQINADRFLPLTGALLPSGELRPVVGTPFDFRQPHLIGERIAASDEQIKLAGGYDHNYVLQKEVEKPAAIARGEHSGIVMELFTDKPGLQLYTSNFLSGADKLSNGTFDVARSSFCLEPQYFPDSPNQPDFPSAVLLPGETYQSQTELRFYCGLL